LPLSRKAVDSSQRVIGDLRVCPAVVDGGHDRLALRAQLPCQVLSLNNSHQQDRDIAARRPRL
jgi:hypothetical protein